jgi:hypothetical protein
MPRGFEAAIGHFLIRFSIADAALNYLIWHLMKLSDRDGMLLTGRLDTRPKVEILRKLVGTHIQDERTRKSVKTVLSHIEGCHPLRNDCAHGMWMSYRGRVFSASHRPSKKNPFHAVAAITLREMKKKAHELYLGAIYLQSLADPEIRRLVIQFAQQSEALPSPPPNRRSRTR